jgi:hypothetical protein
VRTDRAIHLGDLMAGIRGVANPVADYAGGGHPRDRPVAHRNKIAAIYDRLRQMMRDGKSKDESAGI